MEGERGNKMGSSDSLRDVSHPFLESSRKKEKMSASHFEVKNAASCAMGDIRVTAATI